MEASFSFTIGVTADPDHAEGGTGPRDGGVETDLPIHLSEAVVNNLREPKRGSVESEDDGELGEAEDPDAGGAKGVFEAEGVLASAQFLVLFMIELFQQEGFFLGGEPVGLAGVIGEKEGDSQTEKDGGNSFENEKPLPGLEAAPAIGSLEDKSRDGATDDASGGDGGHK